MAYEWRKLYDISLERFLGHGLIDHPFFIGPEPFLKFAIEVPIGCYGQVPNVVLVGRPCQEMEDEKRPAAHQWSGHSPHRTPCPGTTTQRPIFQMNG